MIKVWVKLKYALLYYVTKYMFIVDYLYFMLKLIILINTHLQYNIWFLIIQKRLGYTMFQIKERQLGRLKNSYLTKIFFFDYRVVGSISLLNGYLFSKFMWK